MAKHMVVLPYEMALPLIEAATTSQTTTTQIPAAEKMKIAASQGNKLLNKVNPDVWMTEEERKKNLSPSPEKSFTPMSRVAESTIEAMPSGETFRSPQGVLETQSPLMQTVVKVPSYVDGGRKELKALMKKAGVDFQNVFKFGVSPTPAPSQALIDYSLGLREQGDLSEEAIKSFAQWVKLAKLDQKFKFNSEFKKIIKQSPGRAVITPKKSTRLVKKKLQFGAGLRWRCL